MINYTFKNDFGISKQMVEVANFYQRSFALALLNWEINRQEERLESPRAKARMKK
jgi:hypothetical protein